MYQFIHTDSQDSTPDLRNYMCLGCSPDQPKVTDDANKVIRVCQYFAERLWTGKDTAGASSL